MTRPLAVAALVLLAGCGAVERLPPPPTGIAAVGVEPVENKTGNKLVVSGDSYVAKWIGWEKKTVPDVLTKELESALADRGFAAAGRGAPKLKVVLRRFEPDLPQLAWVNVALTATLADPDGTVRWSGERSSWLVSTSGSPSIESAYGLAARTIARQLVDGWEPKGE
jgi:hypothetical protein